MVPGLCVLLDLPSQTSQPRPLLSFPGFLAWQGTCAAKSAQATSPPSELTFWLQILGFVSHSGCTAEVRPWWQPWLFGSSFMRPSSCSFPDGSVGKESARNAGDLGSIPGLGRAPAERNGNPFHGLYSPWDRKESGTWLSNFTFHSSSGRLT